MWYLLITGREWVQWASTSGIQSHFSPPRLEEASKFFGSKSFFSTLADLGECLAVSNETSAETKNETQLILMRITRFGFGSVQGKLSACTWCFMDWLSTEQFLGFSAISQVFPVSRKAFSGFQFQSLPNVIPRKYEVKTWQKTPVRSDPPSALDRWGVGFLCRRESCGLFCLLKKCFDISSFFAF